jgi:HlyD family secretion protein
MSENGLEPDRSTRRTVSIVQESGRRGAGSTGERRVRRAGSRRQARIALFVVLTIAAVLVAGYFLFIPRDESYVLSTYTTAAVTVETLQDTVELSGVVEARSNATVTAPEAGTMGTLYVDEGDWVTDGQLLALLDAEELEDALDTQELALEKLLREYDRFVLSHEYDVRAFNRRRDNLADAVSDAEEELSDVRELYELGSASLRELEDAEELLEDQQDALEDHDAEVEEALAVYELNRSNYEDDIESLQEEVADLEERLAETRITSPMDGRVIAVADAATTSGERIQQYQTLMEIADARNPLILTEIEEQYVDQVSVGQPVAVEISGSRVEGAIERIGLTAESSSDGGTPTVELDIAIGVGDSEIIQGTSTVVEVLIGEVPDAMVLPRGPFLTSGNRAYLYRVDGSGATRIDVTYGTVTDSEVQILSGVEPGDTIITSSYSNFIEYQTITLGGKQ